MLLPIKQREIERLIPSVATGGQFASALGNPRKILQRIMISSIGGVFTLFNLEGEISYIHLDKGDLLLFPSFISHQVGEVTKGIRYSATAWIEGLSFR